MDLGKEIEEKIIWSADIFDRTINGWDSWGKIFQEKDAFRPLIEHLYRKENLSVEEIENCLPGTNAVFKVGATIVKIFAPKESGVDMSEDYKTELFGIKRAKELGIFAPKLLVHGVFGAKYDFSYLIMEYIKGYTLGSVGQVLAEEEKYNIGRKLKEITQIMNTACAPFNKVDLSKRIFTNPRWNPMAEGFKREREAYLRNVEIQNLVYVHGDINPDNILLDEEYNPYLIDFADALLAPYEYELAVIICELFKFDKAFLIGFLGDYGIMDIVQKCLYGLLLHEFGYNIIQDNLGDAKGIDTLEELRNRLYKMLS